MTRTPLLRLLNIWAYTVQGSYTLMWTVWSASVAYLRCFLTHAINGCAEVSPWQKLDAALLGFMIPEDQLEVCAGFVMQNLL